MLGPLHLIHHPVVTAAGLQRDLRSRRQFFQKLPEYLQIMSHAKRRPVFTLLIDRGEYRKLLVRITSDKMFHKPLQLLPSWGSAYCLAEPCCGAFMESQFAATTCAPTRWVGV